MATAPSVRSYRQVKITIDTGNDAMRSDEDIAQALERVAERVRSGAIQGAILDANGNSVGYFVVPTHAARES